MLQRGYFLYIYFVSFELLSAILGRYLNVKVINKCIFFTFYIIKSVYDMTFANFTLHIIL